MRSYVFVAPVLVACLVSIPSALALGDSGPNGSVSPNTSFGRARAFRERFGLQSDPRWIRSVAADPSANRYLVGVPLTPAEAQDIDQRVKSARATPIIERFVAAHASDSFAGLYMDQRRGGLIYVGFTRGAERALDELRRIFPYPDRLRTFTATRTLTQLQTIQRRIDEDHAILQDLGIDVAITTVNVPTNTVDVTIPAPSGEIAAIMAQRYGSGVRLHRGVVRETIRESVQSPPLTGGIQIHWWLTSEEYIQCTSGFMAHDPSDAHDYVITAGHCGSGGVGSYWYQGFVVPGAVDGPEVGEMGQNEFYSGSSADTGSIGPISVPTLNSSNDIYVNGSTVPITSWEAAGGYIGEPICKSGITSEYTCGELTDSDATITLTADNGLTVTLYHQQIASFFAWFGDSGSPVFYGNEAIGIQSAIECSSSCNQNSSTSLWADSIFSQITYVQNELGLTVNTEPKQ